VRDNDELSVWEKTVLPAATLLSVWDIGWPTRAWNKFTREGVETLGDVIKYSSVDLLRTPNFGLKTLREVESLLAERGLTLR
jgi:DNA-directed RNA polymerase subunit alpha